MNRLQKKCFIGTAGMHLLLMVILFVGPAFFAPKKPDDLPVLEFIPLITTDEPVSGGGNPNARPPAPAPQPQPTPPAPQPQPPQRVEQPDPPKETVRQTKPDPDSVEPKHDNKPHKPEISLKPVVRSQNKSTTKPATTEDRDAEARANAERRNRIANAARTIRESVSGGTTIEMPGPGGGGVPYANFLQAVKTIYSDAWIVPDGVTDDEATATASVTIARDGTVVDAHIVTSSGNILADQSVETALRRVRRAVPLPQGAKENQRTVTIKFNVKAKRGLG